MRSLMIGWEFPPSISGGLGVATHAYVVELSKKPLHLTLILPQALENPTINPKKVTILGCNALKNFNQALLNAHIKTIHLYEDRFHFYPYMSSYFSSSLTLEQFLKDLEQSNIYPNFQAQFSGKYDNNLLGEVFRYAIIAGSLAFQIPHDLIHCHDWLTILAGIGIKNRSHKPLIFHIHALETDRSGECVNKTVFDIEKYGMLHADCIITVSQYTKNCIVKYYGISPDKITVVYNGMYAHESMQQETNKPYPKMVLFLGRVTHQKGPYIFVEIAKKILSMRQDIHFVVAGNGDLLKDMIQQVAKARIGTYVHFTGFLDPKIVAQLYPLASVYVMPSVSEPFGLTSLEALSHNVPIVISKQSGAAEVIQHALKADFWDVDEMANKIMALIDYQALKHELLKNSKRDLQHLSWEDSGQQVFKIYQELSR